MAYSDNFKAEALALLQANGGNIQRTSRALGIHRRALERWRDGVNVNGDVAPKSALKKQELVGILLELAADAVDVMRTKKGDASYGDAYRALGVIVDKLQLLQGEPTGVSRVIIEYEDAPGD